MYTKGKWYKAGNIIVAHGGKSVGQINNYDGNGDDNIDHIVRCVNLHDELVETLEYIHGRLTGISLEDRTVAENQIAKKASEVLVNLAKAKGEINETNR